jgi:hypothetical protein
LAGEAVCGSIVNASMLSVLLISGSLSNDRYVAFLSQEPNRKAF